MIVVAIAVVTAIQAFSGMAQAASRTPGPASWIRCGTSSTCPDRILLLVHGLSSPQIVPWQVALDQAAMAYQAQTIVVHAGLPPGMQRHGAKPSLRDLAGRYTPMVKASARRYGVPPRLVAAVVHVETHADPRILVSSAGAIGPMQLMPHTARRVLNVNPWDRRQNIQGGAHYLAILISRFGSVWKALVAYNAGPTAVESGHPPRASVRYANKVIALAGAGKSRPKKHGIWIVVAQNDESPDPQIADLN